MDALSRIPWLGMLILGLPFFGVVVCYGIFRRSIARAGVDEDAVFPGFVQHVLPYGIATTAIATVAFFVWEISQAGFGGATMMMLAAFGPATFTTGAALGCFTWKCPPK